MTTAELPIVGIGASAGGLDACKALFSALPADTGAAFVVIQHLDPVHPSLMAQLLARATRLTVVQAQDGMQPAPDTVYVIPQGRFLRLARGRLLLDDPVQEKGVRHSIDHFFRSLAESRGERAVAVVLSGTGRDGAQGVREVKAAGGIVVVQEPADAEYDGMPRAALAAGAADVVVPVAEMAAALVRVLRPTVLAPDAPGQRLSEAEPERFLDVLRVLYRHTDYDFRSYRKGTLERRILRRMGLRQIGALADYVAVLRDSPEEVHLLFRDLLIGVTRFFREPAAWEALAVEAVDPLLARKPEGVPIRAWVAGCATGEEAYTLAMVLRECIDRQHRRVPVQIFATDLDERAIDVARTGLYPAAAADDIPPSMREKYFTEDAAGLRVRKPLRESVVFATQNVIADPPFSRLDLITCRNLMIYLEPDVQQRLIEMFHFALAGHGHLLLGSAESAERTGRLFVPVDKAHRLYRRSEAARSAGGTFPVASAGQRTRTREPGPAAPTVPPGAERAMRHLLDRFAPASMLVDRTREIRYFHGPVRAYLDFPEGEASLDLLDVVLPELRSRVRATVNAVLSGQARAEALAIGVPRGDGRLPVRVVAEAVGEGGDADAGILVWFEDAGPMRDAAEEARAQRAALDAASPADRDRIAALEDELRSAREDLHTTVAEFETANEELAASNEEVMSMNEELQSANEELETSREELQSLNEELTTVNRQLEDKIDEVERTNDDLTNLLVSTDIAVIFLDTDLLIRRFTPAIREIMRIIDNDIGRPVEDIALRVRDEALIADARRTLGEHVETEAEIDAPGGHHLIRRMRPYRTATNRVEGVVVTYTDVTGLRRARDAARTREAQQRAVAELGRVALSGVALDAVFDLALARIAEHLNVRLAKVLQLDEDRQSLTLRRGIGWTHAEVGTSKVEAGTHSQAGYTLVRAEPVVVRDFRQETRFAPPPLLTDHGVLAGASVVIGPVADPWGVLGAHETDPARCRFDPDDVNFLQAVANVLWLVASRDRAMAEIEAERARLRDMTDALPMLFAVIDTEGRYEAVNRAYEALGGRVPEIEGAHVSDVIGAEGYAAIVPHVAAVLAGAPQHFEVEAEFFGSGSRRWCLVSYMPRVDDSGAVTGFYSASIDISEQKRLERDLAERFEQYRVLGDSIPFGVWIARPDGMLDYVSQSFLDLVGMTFEEVNDFGWLHCLAPETREETLRLWDETRASGANWEKEHRIIGADGRLYHVLALGRPIRDASGKITSWAGLNLDITARKQEEERLAIVSAELDHRVKNILATVATIARMTGQTAKSVEHFRAAMEDRIQAMASAHKLLSEGNWQGMDLTRLVAVELAPYLETGGDRIEIDGEPVILPPSRVQTVALALHELTTNSAKHGALARDGGHLSIRWAREGCVTLDWVESGLSGVAAPTSAGFGTTLLTRILAVQKTEVHMDYRETGLTARIVFRDL